MTQTLNVLQPASAHARRGLLAFAKRSRPILVAITLVFVGCINHEEREIVKTRDNAVNVVLSLEVNGTDSVSSVRFMLSRDGVAIYRRRFDSGIVQFFQSALSPDEVQGLFEQLRQYGFYKLDGEYDLTHNGVPIVSDYLTYVIRAIDPLTQQLHQTRVLGQLPDPGGIGWVSGSTEPPSAFMRVYYVLARYSTKTERPWLPARINIGVFRTKTGTSCEWPTDWGEVRPASSEREQQANSVRGFLGTITMDGTQLVDVETFINNCRKSAAEGRVLLQGESVEMVVTIDWP